MLSTGSRPPVNLMDAHNNFLMELNAVVMIPSVAQPTVLAVNLANPALLSLVTGSIMK